MLRTLLPLLLGGLSFAVVAAPTVEQRLEKLERQMSRLSALVMEVQSLRTETQQNFGSVEELSHQFKQLKKQQSRQYLDLDQRLAQREGAAAPKQSVTANPSPSSPSSGGEAAAYEKAFALVRSNQGKAALKALNKLIKKYPNGTYTGDAWYWIGRLHRVQGDEKAAARAFAQAKTILGGIVKRFPGTPKAERAATKLKKIAR
ncbi:MAG: tetratricopeptide repeat protein [Gammaproteobacteria bacterium]|jgi:TolA-binding protein|nr:tetratricopeptide repeat protein [Gammaproteobacteria bacterium]MBT3490351.1 tetratricopeptide repeat protein [Gammaproteobacteria bacterium]MBT3718208.1 tetratricopeptide repeat protein [Gammaproteobacteria bacterium]MBT3892150.1 tetratricopeptide repeat protein [Gammaproteobacteria bacterium]MBT4300157.1 tetratricopeptide repeat protein [Gammaproteobacteria bacterium]